MQTNPNISLDDRSVIAERVFLKQLDILYGTSKRGLSSTWLYSTVLLSLSLLDVVSGIVAGVWYAIMLMVITARYLLTRAYYRAPPGLR